MRSQSSTTASPDSDLSSRVLHLLACPQCRSPLVANEGSLFCPCCGRAYPVHDEIADLRIQEEALKPEVEEWSRHWSDTNQELISQRFFSFYRKAVFARTVRYFANRYFPNDGVLVEAGCGTSETSMRIDTRGSERTLVAVDLVPRVLERCHPIMDVRICADIFRLPFSDNSVDGIWNVGVVEHFVHSEIDRMLQEFHRVLKPGARLIVLWPGDSSIPQKVLRALENLINRNRTGRKFQFHPDEISKLKSGEAGRQVLHRNGFKPLYVDRGLRSLMAFITIVGEKQK